MTLVVLFVVTACLHIITFFVLVGLRRRFPTGTASRGAQSKFRIGKRVSKA